jgi:aspartyl-tRNA(Asn)/glutamyl-tRNA(Gln) amidotransferase subunit C
MTKLSAADIRKLARLSRLQLTDDEVEKYQKELSAIVDYFKQLQKVDTNSLASTSQVNGLVNVIRADELIDYGIEQKELLKNAPATQDSQFKVKRMIG